MEIKHVMVIGAGQMGSGIAQVCAQSGFHVKLNDISEEALQKGLAGIEKNLNRSVEKGRMSEEDKQNTLNRLQTTTSLQDASDCDLVIEAVIENMDIKTKVFKELDQITPGACHSSIEYIIPSHYGNRSGNEPPGKSHRHALHEPGASDEAC